MRFGSASAALNLSRTKLPSSLVGDRVGELVRLSARVSELGSAQYIECRLGKTQSNQVDLLISVTKFQRKGLLETFDRELLATPGMASFSRTLQAWNEGSSPLHESVPVVWLEFDDVVHQGDPRANVCASLVPSYIDPFAPLVSQAPSALMRMVQECIGVIRGTPCSPAEEAELGCLISSLPSGAHWIHLSVMTAREPCQLKLYGVFPTLELLPYLERIGWNGDWIRLKTSLDTWCREEQVGRYVYVDLSLSEFADRKPASLGLCFSQQQTQSVSPKTSRRTSLLASLSKMGLCDPTQIDELTRWPGAVELDDKGVATRVERWLDIKVVHTANQGLHAKAYLGYSQTPPGGPLRLGL